MPDPLADVVSLLKPVPSISKRVTGGGCWIVEGDAGGSSLYCAMIEGSCVLRPAGRAPLRLAAGEFVLVPELFGFACTSLEPPGAGAARAPLELGPGVIRLGDPDAPADTVMLVGHCGFSSPNRDLLVALLPDVAHVRGADRQATLMRMIDDETRAGRAGRDMVLVRLLEVLLIEALRATADTGASPGLIRGLADPQLGVALREIHADPARPHSVPALAGAAAMSRSSFYERFRGKVGIAPMAYVTTWRMALAKGMLARKEAPIAEIAQRVGYGSASAFSAAFARHAGLPPGAYAGAVTGAGTEIAAEAGAG
ncbi:MAG: AraC family transcriptional regulator [Roseovarius sp.]|uniref:helix-turn-helix transcriptional regulator n=1 Tax=Roseovarius sp. TaxID=1486281 RepID=UPI0032EC14AF